MNDNLAREYELRNEAQPKQTPKEITKPETKNVVTKKKLTRIEKGVIFLIGIAVFVLLILNISFAMQVSTANRDVQEISRQTTEAQVVNENLEQNVQELSRYDRVYDIANQHGLELNEESIRNVAP